MSNEQMAVLGIMVAIVIARVFFASRRRKRENKQLIGVSKPRVQPSKTIEK